MLGQALVEAYADQDVIAWDRGDCDVTDTELTAQKITEAAPDLIINPVAYTNVDKAEQEPEAAARLNAEVPGEIATVASELDVPLVHVSTAYVFDGTDPNGYGESAVPNPQHVYATTKYAGEQRVLEVYPEGSYVVRTNWLFGKPATSEGAKQSFVDKISTLARERDELSLVSDEIGSPAYAPDLAHRIREIVENEEPGLYHAVNDGSCSWHDWALEAFRLQDIDVKVTPVSGKIFERAAPPPQYTIVLCEKTGPMRHWKEALAEHLATQKGE